MVLLLLDRATKLSAVPTQQPCSVTVKETQVIVNDALHLISSMIWPMGVGRQLGRCSAWSINCHFALALVPYVWHMLRRLEARAHLPDKTAQHVHIQACACIYLGKKCCNMCVRANLEHLISEFYYLRTNFFNL